MQRVVIHDPIGEIRQGSIINGGAQVIRVENRRVVTLPVEVEQFYAGAIDGFFFRAWGDGYRFDRMQGRRVCPMVMRVTPSKRWIYWVAGLRITGDDPQGTIRLTADTSMGKLSGGLAQDGRPVLVQDYLEKSKDHDGLVVGGRCRLNIALEGDIGLTLYGVASDVAVLWSAATQSSQEVRLPYHMSE